MCLFVFVLNVPEKRWKVSSLKYHSVLLLLSSSLGSPMVLLCNSAQKKRKCFCMASRAHFSFRTPAAHTSQHTNTDIFLSSVSSRCWRLLFCLMKAAPLFVSCLMFQEASHFQVLLVILASMLMGARGQHAVVLQARSHVVFSKKHYGSHIHLKTSHSGCPSYSVVTSISAV